MERIGDELRLALRRFGGGGMLARIVSAWPGAVGEAIARNAWPSRLARDGTLHVATNSSAWAFELTQLEAMIRRRLEEALGEASLGRLRFAPGRLPERGSTETAPGRQRAPRPGPGEHSRAKELVADLDNEELRALVVRAAAACLAKARSDHRF